MENHASNERSLSRRTFLGSAAIVGASMALSPSLALDFAEASPAASGAESSALATASSSQNDILLGMFFSAETNFTNTLYTSLDGVSFEKIGVAYQDMDGDGPGVAYNQYNDGCLGNPSIIYYKGLFWACSVYDKEDGTFTLTFGASNDLKTWARPSGAITTLEGGWPTYGNNAVAADWFVDDDGSVYVVACCGTMGAAHGLDWRADEMYPYIFKATRFDVTDSSALSGDLSGKYVDWFAKIELSPGRRINLPSLGEVGENNRIDGSFYKEDGVYYLCIKRNGETNEIWSNPNIEDCNGWSIVNRDVVGGSEGPSLVKWGNTHFLYTDKLPGDWSFKGYGNDLDRGTWWVSAERLWDQWSAPSRILTSPMSMQRLTRHGTVLRVTDPEAQEKVWRARQEAGYRVPVHLYGQNFDETAVAESRAAFPNGADAVVIAGQNGWQDALAASGLAGGLDCPILICAQGGLSAAVSNEISRLGARNAIVVGGPVAVSNAVIDQLRALGCSTTRLAGWNEFETCYSIYCYGANKRFMSSPGSNAQHEGAVYGEGNIRGRNIWGSDVAIVATGMSFADALSASPIAYARKAPLFMVRFAGMWSNDNRLADELAAGLAETGAQEVLVCGGEGVIPGSTIDQVRAALPNANVVRKGGEDAIETSMLIADYAVSRWGMSYDGVAFATADAAFGGTDALAGSAVCGKANTVLLLADGRTIDFANSRSDIGTVRFFGGPAVLSYDFRRRVVGGRARYGL